MNFLPCSIKSSLFWTPSSLSLPNRKSSLWNQIQTKDCVISARKSRRRNGYRRSRKFILDSIRFVASNLNILPEPLALVIREFGGGNGGGFGFWKGFGGEGFDGWGRKRNNKLGFLGFAIVFGLGMWLVSGKELGNDVILGFLALSLLGVSVNGWKRVVDGILGFCFCAVLVGLGISRRENLQKWAKGFKVTGTLRRRKGRRPI
ncbi:uncharacterized protein LOC127812544 [Diospyros lotus]|uniref:uncharacterized protein LOC127812544 n=1 Tax=Diospyros lotus TaxID=55363 RepID=UPI00225C37B9|nr:uncharacterized protein LOC127812544 [Diospyros lotus]